jgi:TonB family protein
VAAVVDQGGTVTYAEVRESSGHAMLDTAALDAVVNGYYRAARRDGKAVKSRITIPVEFRLDGDTERTQSDKSPGQLEKEKRELENAKRMLEEEQRQLQEEIERLKAQQKKQQEEHPGE